MDEGESQGQSGDGAAAGAGGTRRRRRRQRTQRNKRNRSVREVRAVRPARHEPTSRERIFQDVEGLLRQIREQAEETALWSAAELKDLTQAVTAFTRALDQESDPVSDRWLGEYQRIREKLNHSLKGKAA